MWPVMQLPMSTMSSNLANLIRPGVDDQSSLVFLPQPHASPRIASLGVAHPVSTPNVSHLPCELLFDVATLLLDPCDLFAFSLANRVCASVGLSLLANIYFQQRRPLGIFMPMTDEEVFETDLLLLFWGELDNDRSVDGAR